MGRASATKWFPELAKSLAAVEGGPFIVDGEVCALDELGRSDFGALPERARWRRWFEGVRPVSYCVFDLLAAGVHDLTSLPRLERKEALADILSPAPRFVLLVGHIEEHAETLFKTAVQQLKLEGLVAKRAESIYRPGVRSADWVKVKRAGAIPAALEERSWARPGRQHAVLLSVKEPRSRLQELVRRGAISVVTQVQTIV